MQLLIIRSKSTNGKKEHHAMEAASQENQLQKHNTTVAPSQHHCRPKPGSLSPHVRSLPPQARITVAPSQHHCRPKPASLSPQARIIVAPSQHHCRPKPASLSPHVRSLPPQARIIVAPSQHHCRSYITETSQEVDDI